MGHVGNSGTGLPRRACIGTWHKCGSRFMLQYQQVCPCSLSGVQMLERLTVGGSVWFESSVLFSYEMCLTKCASVCVRVCVKVAC